MIRYLMGFKLSLMGLLNITKQNHKEKGKEEGWSSNVVK